MRLPRVQFTVRRMMRLVAAAALSLGTLRWVVEMRHRSADYQRQAYEHEVSMMRSGSLTTLPYGRRVDRYEDENDRLHDAWASQLVTKYRHLPYYPWLATEADPPRPVPLAHPRSAYELPARIITEVDVTELKDDWFPRPPAWTFLWTSPRRY